MIKLYDKNIDVTCNISYNISILIIDFIKYIIINKIELEEIEDVSSFYPFRLNSLLYIFQNKIVQVLPHHKINR